MRRTSRIALGLLLIANFILPFSMPAAHALTLTATGTNPTICNQAVSDTTNVIAYRITDGDCVVEFKNAGASVTWSAPSLISNVKILVVAGGGGGGGRHSGGGGGGGVIYATNYGISAGSNYVLFVGNGGAGSTGATGGYGNAGQYSYFNSSSGSGSLVANGGGGGGGSGGAPNQGNYDGTLASGTYPGRGSGGGSNYTTTNGGSAAPGTVSDVAKSYGTTSVTINSVSTTVNAYGKSGGMGKGDGTCVGANGDSGWCGGGGGGAAIDGAAPTQPSGSNPWRAGVGGTGVGLDITGVSTYYAGGGGGGSGSNLTGRTSNDACKTISAAVGTGGNGGGGAGGQCLDNATSGTANTGGGGGGGGLGYITGNSRESGNGGNGGSGIVIVRYTPDSVAPVYSNGTSFNFAENSLTTANAATITVDEASTITINSGVDLSIFNVISNTGTSVYIRFKVSPNFESPTDSGANNVYNITVRATDVAGNYADQSISITVTNVNEAPIIGANAGSATYSFNNSENSAALYNINATDVDAGTTLTYSLTGTDSADFTISALGVLSFNPSPDFENPLDSDTNNIYVVIAWVSDGTLTDSQTVTVTVTNINESSSLGAPTISGTAYKGFTTSLTVTVNAPGKVRFFIDGKRIANCLAVSTTGTYPNYLATCNWKPALTNRHNLTATFTPSDNTFSSSSSAVTSIWILKRTTTR